MKAEGAQQILNNLYGLLMEMNLLQSDDDALNQSNILEDPFIQKHLKNIKLLSAKYAAVANRSRYQTLKNEFKKLKEQGVEELKKMLQPQDVIELQPLFRKFEEITPEDEQDIIEDQEFLLMLEQLKKKLDEK